MSAMNEDRVRFSRIDEHPDDWKPMPYVDRLEWRGWYVLIDGDTVQFGDGEYDWVKPVAKSGQPQPLDRARLAQNGRWLIVTSGPYEFIFYDVSEEERTIGDGMPYPPLRVFHYRWRYRNRFHRLALKMAQKAVRRLQ